MSQCVRIPAIAQQPGPWQGGHASYQPCYGTHANRHLRPHPPPGSPAGVPGAAWTCAPGLRPCPANAPPRPPRPPQPSSWTGGGRCPCSATTPGSPGRAAARDLPPPRRRPPWRPSPSPCRCRPSCPSARRPAAPQARLPPSQRRPPPQPRHRRQPHPEPPRPPGAPARPPAPPTRAASASGEGGWECVTSGVTDVGHPHPLFPHLLVIDVAGARDQKVRSVPHEFVDAPEQGLRATEATHRHDTHQHAPLLSPCHLTADGPRLTTSQKHWVKSLLGTVGSSVLACQASFSAFHLSRMNVGDDCVHPRSGCWRWHPFQLNNTYSDLPPCLPCSSASCGWVSWVGDSRPAPQHPAETAPIQSRTAALSHGPSALVLRVLRLHERHERLQLRLGPWGLGLRPPSLAHGPRLLPPRRALWVE